MCQIRSFRILENDRAEIVDRRSLGTESERTPMSPDAIRAAATGKSRIDLSDSAASLSWRNRSSLALLRDWLWRVRLARGNRFR